MNEKQRSKHGCPVIPELLAPAGSFEKLETAIHYGADAVYLGGTRYGLRARAGKFDREMIREALRYSHARGVKVYVTINIIAHNEDLDGLEDYLLFLEKCGTDGLIISDPGVLSMAAATVRIPVHLSTQANVTNSRTAHFWVKQGVSRLNLARELSLTEITEIRRAVNSELEVFVHGALCISYSGRCMLSSYMTGRDANQGNCAHPCRYSYALLEEKRPGEYFRVEEDARGTYIFNSKDLCLLKRLPELVAVGVDSLKIEGRMKSIFYVGGVVRVYRAALDYLKSLKPQDWGNPSAITIPEEMIIEIERTGTRDSTENFFDEKPGPSEMLYLSSRQDQLWEPVAVVRGVGTALRLEVRNVLEAGENIEYMQKGIGCAKIKLVAMKDLNGNELTRANPGNVVVPVFDELPDNFEINGIFRRRKSV